MSFYQFRENFRVFCMSTMEKVGGVLRIFIEKMKEACKFHISQNKVL